MANETLRARPYTWLRRLVACSGLSAWLRRRRVCLDQPVCKRCRYSYFRMHNMKYSRCTHPAINVPPKFVGVHPMTGEARYETKPMPYCEIVNANCDCVLYARRRLRDTVAEWQ